MHKAIAAMLACLVFWPTTAQSTDQTPRRIVSLNLCVDQILIDVVAPQRIASLSHLAADPELSTVSDRARALPSTPGDAETVLGLDPDLVLAGTFTNAATLTLLERVGRRVIRIALASDLDGIRDSVRQIAGAVGETERGAAIIAAFDVQLAALRVQATPGERKSPKLPTALMYQINGLASGPGTLDDAVLRAAGFRNLAFELRLGSGGRLPLEALVAVPPDLLVLSTPSGQHRTAVADNLRHPGLAKMRRGRASIELPWRTFLCGTPAVTEAIEELTRARRALKP